MQSISRRQLIRTAAGAGLGLAGGLFPRTLWGQAGAVPTWQTETRQLAPNIYAYIQGGGPASLNQGVSNGGFIVGKDDILVLDSLGNILLFTSALKSGAATSARLPSPRVVK